MSSMVLRQSRDGLDIAAYSKPKEARGREGAESSLASAEASPVAEGSSPEGRPVLTAAAASADASAAWQKLGDHLGIALLLGAEEADLPFRLAPGVRQRAQVDEGNGGGEPGGMAEAL
eukprot:CAMPEP_0204116184 /NCGR_PEP_ID=MMETSP0361-20130328/5260_1 /ASSEMBLY_ACC=CAM_ASM_000343 /TAXON_ID=268821 /ORGANISM="Scrippsiella Hangoei, Strain SHTV-5" /LENGTH=117 /DNA_ID=CAMNT_0051066939 /DNA_START=100 /DNA_END=451 /DNA_ORIENTATION=+